MHCTYYFLKSLSSELHLELQNAELIDSYTQSKHELVLSFEVNNQQKHLIVNINREFNAFGFKEEVHKSKSGFQNCFKNAIGKRCVKVVQVPYDRSFFIQFKDDSKLLFKMHGSRSNILYLNSNNIVEQLFEAQLKEDKNIELQELQQARPSISNCTDENELLQSNPLLGKNTKYWLKNELNQYDTIEQKEDFFHQYIKQISSWENNFYVTGLCITAWQKKESTKCDSAIDASNELYLRLNYHYYYTKRKEQAIKDLERTIKRLKAYIIHAKQELEKLIIGSNFREKADVVMANLHVLTQAETDYNLLNFYSNTSFDFRFKKGEKPQLIAQKWYSKSKNQHKQVSTLKQTLESKEHQLIDGEQKLISLNEIQSVRELNIYLKKQTTTSTKETSPFKQTTFQGFEILIGRNSKNNDELVKYGHKSDIWLHAKDVSGSHVLIRTQQKTAPQIVIEHAASLAAYYSKRKTDSMCPVMYTELKYVRKRKGFLPGQVVTEREKVLIVLPQSISETTQN